MAVYRWVILILQFATVLPTPQLENVELKELRQSVMFLPLVGALLGCVLWVVDFGLRWILPAWPASIVAVAVFTLLIGALHLDGLMDTADAIGSRKPREQALEIMKDSRIGAMGAVACVFVLLLKVSCVGSFDVVHHARQTWGLFLLVPMLSRLGMLWSMQMAPSARPNSGLGQIYAQKIPGLARIVGVLSPFLLSLFLVPGRDVWIIYLIVISFTNAFTYWMKRKFGGMTGDTYGALNELLEVVLWLTMDVLQSVRGIA